MKFAIAKREWTRFMVDKIDCSLETLSAKGTQVFDPNFFGMYSFEYAYRLLLVYLSTNSTAIKGIRMSNPNAFDDVFKEDISKAVSHVLNYRGIAVTENVVAKLVGLANETLVLFIKSSMANPPQKIAKTVAKSMDKAIVSSLGPNARSLAEHVFEEK